MMANKKTNRGGARPGAGRKAGPVKVRVAYKLAPETVAVLDAVASTGKMSRAVAIEYAVDKVFGSVFGPGCE